MGTKDILEITMVKNANLDKKWRVMGVIDPNKHLSTLDHSVNIEVLEEEFTRRGVLFNDYEYSAVQYMTGMSAYDGYETSDTDSFPEPRCSDSELESYSSESEEYDTRRVNFTITDPFSQLDVVNYHHWIPSVFRVNKEGTKCELLSEIPNLDPYECGDTLYPLIEELFLYQLPQFENVLDLNLRGVPLRVIVKAQDYQLDDCKEQDYYLGNFHKEGLYEDIMAVGLYYYHIDEDIKGGELQLSSLIETEVTEDD